MEKPQAGAHTPGSSFITGRRLLLDEAFTAR
jgi:hypothetical protein